MGLDMYAYAGKMNDKNERGEELAYWRKHPNLHGWFERLWNSKGCPGGDDRKWFNTVPLQLTKEDLDQLEKAIKSRSLPPTTGFFFGSDSDDHYYQADLDFVNTARQMLDAGRDVWYNSWW